MWWAGHFIVTFGCIALCALPLSRAQAAEGEIQLSLDSGLTALQRDDHLNIGAGGGVFVSYGLTHHLALGIGLLADHLRAVREGSASSGPAGASYTRYDLTRLALVPAVALHFGSRYVTELQMGVGYRAELRTGQVAVVDRRSRPASDAMAHTLVAQAAVSWEWLFCDLFSVTARVRVGRILAGLPGAFDGQASLALSFYFFT